MMYLSLTDCEVSLRPHPISSQVALA